MQIDVKTRIERPRTVQIPNTPFAIPVPPPEDGEDGGIVASGAGSGFFISADGYIVTNNHVVQDATEITVKLADSRELNARVVGRDEATDLAVIKVEGSDFPFVTFEEQAQPRVGDWVIAVGNPFGLGGTATAGIVSGAGRGNIDSAYVDYLQIDAAINRGNSGGPTFDIYGRVIGVNTAIYSETGGSVGIGFAIPASVAKPITERLMRGETIARGYVGVGIQDVSRETVEALGLEPNAKVAYIGEVTPGGPADSAGLQLGDIVIRMNGQPILGRNDLTRRIGQVRPGETVRLEVLRDGRRQTVNVRAGTRPPESELSASQDGSEGPNGPVQPQAGEEAAGLTVVPMSDAVRRRYSIPDNVEGLVVTTARTIGDLRFQPGYVIRRSATGVIRTPEDLRAAVSAARAADRPGTYLIVWTPQQGSVPIVLPFPDPE
ncbi:MAG: trypsin-like peptidase domain-containing protein [Brevundimonas sp.]|nr:trypsin-like peptidase domain-containing protein [Brevundimonas sp.]